MSTTCYAMVRGSAIRATALDDRGRYGDPITFATSKAVAKVQINAVTEAAKIETESNPEEEGRTRFIRPSQMIRNTVDINFVRVDPRILNIITGAPLAGSAPLGFDEIPFDTFGFDTPYVPDARGFDADTRAPITSFALEVWSKLQNARCATPAPTGGFGEMPFGEDAFGEGAAASVSTGGFGEMAFGEEPFGEGAPAPSTQMWGYTLFQHLRGGRISGFTFANGLVSFNIIGAQSRRSKVWGVGPYDLEGDYERMTSVVSRNNAFRQMITSAQPPTDVCGLQTRYDVISNGTPTDPMPDPSAPLVLSGGGVTTSPYIISGGRP